MTTRSLQKAVNNVQKNYNILCLIYQIKKVQENDLNKCFKIAFDVFGGI